MFEALWPKQRDKIALIEGHIRKHADLFNNEVTIENIQKEHEARIATLERFKRQESFEASQKFRALESAVGPPMFDDKLDWLRSRTCDGSARWFLEDPVVKQWQDTSAQLTRFLWLRGIPGAGKISWF